MASADGGPVPTYILELVRRAPFGIYLVDADFRLIEISEGCRSVFAGVQPLIGRDFGEILRIIWPEAFADEAIERFRHTLATGESYHSPNTTQPRANVSAVESYDWQIERLTMPDGRPGVVCYFYDTTVRVQAEAELSERQARLETFLKAGRLGLWQLDAANGELETSETCRANFGRLADQSFTYRDLTASIHPADRERWQDAVDTAIGSCSDFEVEYRTIWPDGSVHWMLVRGTCFPGPDNRTARLAGITADVTDRIDAVQELIEGSQFNQEIIDSLASHIAVVDRNGVITAVNKAWRRFACENGAEWTMKGVGVGVNYLDVCNATEGDETADARLIHQGIKGVLEGGEGLFTFEYPCHSPTQQRWFLLSVSPLEGFGGGAVVAHTNITERRIAEEALRKSQERFDIVKDGAEIGFWFCDLPFDELDWDNRVKEHFWLPIDARVTIDTFYSRIHPDDREMTRTSIEGSIRDKTRYHIDYRTVSPEGEIKWIRALGRTFYDVQGQPIRFDGVTLDITERKQAEQALRESEERFRNMADNAPVMIWVTDPDGMCTYLSQSWYEFTGQTPETGLGMGWVDATHPEDAAMTEHAFLSANEHHSVFRVEYRLRRHDGQYRWAIDSAQPRFGADGEFLGYIGSVIDIDERKEAERLLEKTNADLQLAWSELQATYDQSPIGLAQFDTELRFVRINEQLAAMNGLPPADHIGKTIYEILPKMAPKVEADFKKIIATGEPMRDIEVVGQTPADPGVEHTWLESWFPLHAPDGTIIGLNAVAQDITDRRHAERALRDRELLESAVKFQEAERRRIARDLHDQLGQQLTGLRLTLEDLFDSSADSPKLREKIQKAQQNALDLDKDVSSLAFELRANILSEQGLAEALEKFVADWSRNYGTTGEFQLVDSQGNRDLPDEIETHLYRIAQEALNNATKHSKATRVGVILEIRRDLIRLIVEDDGVGFDPGAAAAASGRKDGHGIGLIGMHERAELLRGTLEIDSAAGQGTTIFVTVPL